MSNDTEPILLRVPEAARLLGIGRTKAYGLVASGELETVRIDRAVRIPTAAVERYVERLRARTVTGRK